MDFMVSASLGYQPYLFSHDIGCGKKKGDIQSKLDKYSLTDKTKATCQLTTDKEK